MPVWYRARDDIFATKNADVFVNYPTIEGEWEKGLGAVFRKHFPGLYESWVEFKRSTDGELGVIHSWKDPVSGVYIFNIPLKRHYQDGQDELVTVTALEQISVATKSYVGNHAKVVMPIVLNSDGVSWSLDQMYNLLIENDILFEISLSPMRLTESQAARKTIGVVWECGAKPEVVFPQIRKLMVDAGIKNFNTQMLLFDQYLFQSDKNRFLKSLSYGNALTSTRYCTFHQDDSLWLKDKGLDGILSITGSQYPVGSLSFYDM